MPAKLQALVIDDEPDISRLIAEVLRQEGWDVTEAASAEEAYKLLPTETWGAVFSDVVLGGDDGFSVLRRFKQEIPATPVVLITGHASALGALDATSCGAYDYLLKPFEMEKLQALAQALKEQVLNYRPRQVRSPVATTKYQPDLRLLGRSEAFIEVMKNIGRIASTNLPVLLIGESGTGKEVIAASLHSRSPRREHPFVAVNCGAISADLIESELFGHVKGSFPGADSDRPGLWEAADQGPIFLDEITETTSAFQVKALRALQQGEIRQVGSNETRKVDVRVIAASNRNVEDEVAEGRFRQDLFYRLNPASIRLPPLRERREDILLLAKSFAERVYSLSPPVKFSQEVLQLLEQYSWPGNIRELENAVVMATAVCDGTIRVKDLPKPLQTYAASREENRMKNQGDGSSLEDTPEEHLPLSVVEGRHVARVLAYTGGNKQAAARLLNVDRKTLDRMIKRHGIGNIATSSSHRQ
jgi:two-component system response regulator AtoC